MSIDPSKLDLIDIDRGYAAPELEKQDTITEFIFSNEPLINKFMASLLGMIYDKEKNQFKKLDESKDVIPLMNNYGVTRWAGYLSTLTDRSVLHSNLNKEEVCELAFQEMLYILCDLFQNAEDYDLDQKHFDYFLGQMLLIVFTTLKRPQDAGERRAINTRGKVFEHKVVKSEDTPSSYGGSSSQQGFFSGMRRKR